MLVSADVYTPAGHRSAEDLWRPRAGRAFSRLTPSMKPHDIANGATGRGKLEAYDVLILDTAGRLAVDEFMMKEIAELHKALNPIETYFVVDAMTGQDAAVTAKAFAEALPLTGVILTKADGDARGGAALSVREITGKPIKFIGMGEKIEALEPFHPDRIASRILDMGDMLSLIEDLQRKTDMGEARKFADKIKKGQGFTFEDFKAQMLQVKKMGGMGGLLSHLPGAGQLAEQVKGKLNEKMIDHMIAIIDSMTRKEREHPEIIKASRASAASPWAPESRSPRSTSSCASSTASAR